MRRAAPPKKREPVEEIDPQAHVEELLHQVKEMEDERAAEAKGKKMEEIRKKREILQTKRKLQREIKHTKSVVKHHEVGTKDVRKEVSKLDKDEEGSFSRKHKREEKFETTYSKVVTKKSDKATVRMNKVTETGEARMKAAHMAFALRSLEQEQILPLEDARKQGHIAAQEDWLSLANTQGSVPGEASCQPRTAEIRVENLHKEIETLEAEGHDLQEEHDELFKQLEEAKANLCLPPDFPYHQKDDSLEGEGQGDYADGDGDEVFDPPDGERVEALFSGKWYPGYVVGKEGDTWLVQGDVDPEGTTIHASEIRPEPEDAPPPPARPPAPQVQQTLPAPRLVPAAPGPLLNGVPPGPSPRTVDEHSWRFAPPVVTAAMPSGSARVLSHGAIPLPANIAYGSAPPFTTSMTTAVGVSQMAYAQPQMAYAQPPQMAYAQPHMYAGAPGFGGAHMVSPGQVYQPGVVPTYMSASGPVGGAVTPNSPGWLSVPVASAAQPVSYRYAESHVSYPQVGQAYPGNVVSNYPMPPQAVMGGQRSAALSPVGAPLGASVLSAGEPARSGREASRDPPRSASAAPAREGGGAPASKGPGAGASRFQNAVHKMEAQALKEYAQAHQQD